MIPPTDTSECFYAGVLSQPYSDNQDSLPDLEGLIPLLNFEQVEAAIGWIQQAEIEWTTAVVALASLARDNKKLASCAEECGTRIIETHFDHVSDEDVLLTILQTDWDSDRIAAVLNRNLPNLEEVIPSLNQSHFHQVTGWFQHQGIAWSSAVIALAKLVDENDELSEQAEGCACHIIGEYFDQVPDEEILRAIFCSARVSDTIAAALIPRLEVFAHDDAPGKGMDIFSLYRVCLAYSRTLSCEAVRKTDAFQGIDFNDDSHRSLIFRDLIGSQEQVNEIGLLMEMGRLDWTILRFLIRHDDLSTFHHLLSKVPLDNEQRQELQEAIELEPQPSWASMFHKFLDDPVN